MIYLGADHRGFFLKEKIKSLLRERRIDFEDLGPTTLVKEDDYPEYGAKVGEAVARSPETHRGIVICGSGAGICVTANKFRGVRAALAATPEMARAIRNDDDTNVLCLAADFIGEADVLPIVQTWLDTPFATSERYQRRIEEIKEIEDRG